jgi:nucleotide-binding universal stress UspA family protein
MGSIVCATRGGEVSRRTQEQAVALAKERGEELIFLYVVDPSFAGTVNEMLKAALTDELTRLGRSLLCIAQARAQEEGIAARTAIRRGPTLQSIQEYLREVDASVLVIGAPRGNVGMRGLDSEEVYEQAEAICGDMGIEMVVVS